MKLHLTASDARYSFSGYGAGYVEVNGKRYQRSVIVTPERLVEPWLVSDWAALATEHFAAIVELRPSVVLLGSGARQRFPHPSLTRALIDARIGLEVMDTQAACRTYNILVGEGRAVAAAVIVE
jgi:uncharacterized protein